MWEVPGFILTPAGDFFETARTYGTSGSDVIVYQDGDFASTNWILLGDDHLVDVVYRTHWGL